MRFRPSRLPRPEENVWRLLFNLKVEKDIRDALEVARADELEDRQLQVGQVFACELKDIYDSIAFADQEADELEARRAAFRAAQVLGLVVAALAHISPEATYAALSDSPSEVVEDAARFAEILLTRLREEGRWDGR